METSNPLYNLDRWQNIIHTEDWRVFLNLLDEHKKYLQGQVNNHLSKYEDRKAGEELAKMKDCDKIISLVSKAIEDLRKQQPEGVK